MLNFDIILMVNYLNILVISLLCLIYSLPLYSMPMINSPSQLATNPGQSGVHCVMLINPNISSNSNAYLVHNAFKSLRKRYPELVIRFLFKNSGISSTELHRYLKELYKIDIVDDAHARADLISESGYDSLSTSALSELLVYQDDFLTYRTPLKFIDPDKVQIYSKYKYEVEKPVVVSNEFIQTNLNQFWSFDSNTVLHLADAGNRLGILNLNTGKYSKIFELNKIDRSKLYDKFILPINKNDLSYNHKDEEWFLETNRPSVLIYNASIDINKKNIYLVTGLHYKEQIVDPKANQVKRYGLSKDDEIVNYYLFLIQLDFDLNIVNEVYIHDYMGTFQNDKIDIMAYPESYFEIKDSSMYAINDVTVEPGYSSKLIKDKMFSKYEFQGNELKWSSFTGGYPFQDLDKRSNLSLNTIYAGSSDNRKFLLNSYSFIFDPITQDKKVDIVQYLRSKGYVFKKNENLTITDQFNANDLHIWVKGISATAMDNKYYFLLRIEESCILFVISHEWQIEDHLILPIHSLFDSNMFFANNVVCEFAFNQELDGFEIKKYRISKR